MILLYICLSPFCILIFTKEEKDSKLLTGGIIMPDFYECYASAAFGLEGVVASELRDLGMLNVASENGGVRFSASEEDIMKCNLSLRCCDRVFILLAESVCTSFDALFNLVRALPWEQYMNGTEQINISSKCVRSRLMSPRDCQSITKKAVIERLREKTSRRIFPESGAAFPVSVMIHQDRTRILLNTSGEALSRRGYRTWNGEAPLRETLAAALVLLSPWNQSSPLYDPCCGTGTILAEAALLASHTAPGLRRSFAMEGMAFTHSEALLQVRKSLQSLSDPGLIPAFIGGSDIDDEALKLSRRHFQQAGISDHIHLSKLPLQELTLSEENGVFICNPPYGERLSDQASCRNLYRDLRLMKDRHPTWKLCAISSDPAFERFYGKKASKKRRLYNGRLECNYYIFND